jgi:hypothetical protein
MNNTSHAAIDLDSEGYDASMDPEQHTRLP